MIYYKLTISYDGSSYFGWQIQSGSNPTVAGEISEVLKKVFKTNQFKLVGGGRTDAKVHAFNQIAKLSMLIDLNPSKLQMLLNRYLKNIRIKKVEKVDASFHPLKSKSKEYHYFFTDTQYINPFNYRYITGINLKDFDKSLFATATKYFIGTHDFGNFFITGSDVLTTCKTIYQISLHLKKDPYPYYQVKIIGNGFLRQMVRMVVGSLYMVAIKKLSGIKLQEMIEMQVVKKGYVAPPQGLYLKKIIY